MYVSNRKESSNKLIIQTEKHTEPMETQNIKQLEICPKKDWAIKVTVSRKWRRIPINNQTIGLNLILIDQTVSILFFYECINFCYHALLNQLYFHVKYFVSS